MTLRFFLVAALLAGVASSGARAQRSGFPHSRHETLFPSCSGCHQGITTGDAANAFPSPKDCAACHDGTQLDAVRWTGHTKKPTNVVFSHAEHLASSAEAGARAECVACHATAADTAWMHVRAAAGAGCVTCHTNATSEHLAPTAKCRTCHRTLTESRELTAAMIAAFPKPASHSAADFAAKHAPTSDASIAQCATCHARESCVRCHANASSVRAIAQLAPDPRVAELMRGRAALYPTPVSHRDGGWTTAHGGAAAKSIATCANCHTQTGCRTCHAGDRAPRVIAELPLPGPNGAPGVALTRVTMHEVNFLDRHKTSAASGRLDCTSCHQQRECTSCHEGASSRRYHAAEFASRHASEAFSQEQTCTTCHRTETFCRNCHLQNGVATTGAKSGAAHTGQPLWLLQHGEAARRGLTECTTCHQQRDCLRCHSSQGLKVNPHGPDFDASRMSTRAKQMCATCHVKEP
jgi:cytochrome c7-like protein